MILHQDQRGHELFASASPQTAPGSATPTSPRRHQMDVAGPFAQSRRDNQVHQVDHRRLVGHHLDVMEIPRFSVHARLRVEVLDHLLDRHLIRPGDLLQNLVERRRLLLDFQPREQRRSSITCALAGAAEAMTSTPGGPPPAESMSFGKLRRNQPHPLRRRRHLRPHRADHPGGPLGNHINSIHEMKILGDGFETA